LEGVSTILSRHALSVLKKKKMLKSTGQTDLGQLVSEKTRRANNF